MEDVLYILATLEVGWAVSTEVFRAGGSERVIIDVAKIISLLTLSKQLPASHSSC